MSYAGCIRRGIVLGRQLGLPADWPGRAITCVEQLAGADVPRAGPDPRPAGSGRRGGGGALRAHAGQRPAPAGQAPGGRRGDRLRPVPDPRLPLRADPGAGAGRGQPGGRGRVSPGDGAAPDPLAHHLGGRLRRRPGRPQPGDRPAPHASPTCSRRRCAGCWAATSSSAAPTSPASGCASTSATTTSSPPRSGPRCKTLVNRWLGRPLQVERTTMTEPEARALGAIGAFGEKYGATVSGLHHLRPATPARW